MEKKGVNFERYEENICVWILLRFGFMNKSFDQKVMWVKIREQAGGYGVVAGQWT